MRGLRVDSVTGAKHGVVRARQPMRQTHGQADARSKVQPVGIGDRVHRLQSGRIWKRRIVQIQQTSAIVAERRKVFVTQPSRDGDARREAPVVLNVRRVTILPQVSLRVTDARCVWAG